MSWGLSLGMLILLFLFLNTSPRGQQIGSWEQFVKLIAQPKLDDRGDPVLDAAGQPVLIPSGKISDNLVLVENNRLVATVNPGVRDFPASEKGTLITFSIDAQSRDLYIEKLMAMGVDHIARTGTSLWLQFLAPLIPFVLIVVLIWFFIARSMRSASGGPGGMLGSFGKSRHRISSKDTVDVTFDDVAGVDEAKEELTEIVEFLKKPKRFERLGGRIPRGALLVGPPGCGKTLLAKAIAGEADVPFFSISGSDFVEMFVGVGASRVRDLFKQAKENSPCIIFLDEIDAVGRRRGGGFTTGGHDEREQTLNAILVEMDGFEAHEQIIVIAATNRFDILDPALTRPGRFDRQVPVTLPDIVGRKQILEVHARNVKLSPSIDLERIARGTPMFSGADLAALINEAAILATMVDRDFVEMPDLEEARDKIRFGRARKSRRIEEKEREATAYHEAGHAVVQAALDDADPIHKVTIIPRGQAMGATFSLPEKDRYGFGRKYVLATMRVLCAGRIAEQRKTDDISSGAAMDIQTATQFARHMILEWGMSERLGFVNYAGLDSRESYFPDKEYSDETARIIDEETKRLIDEAYVDAERILSDKWEQVDGVAQGLLKYETLNGEDVDHIMHGERLDKPTVAELLQTEVARAAAPPSPPAVSESEDPGEEPAGDVMPSPA